MARKARIFSQSGIHHIIMRGNNQQNIFCSNKDRLFFTSRMQKYASELNINIFSYCLMNNHIHILLKTEKNAYLSLFVQKLANSYVFFFNRKYERTGHLFQGRFKSEPIDDDNYFKTVLRYILQNPDKAGICKFQDYRWNNYLDIINSKKNSDYVYKLFDNKENLIHFLAEKSNEKIMEYENKRISDSKVVELLKTQFNIHNPYKLIHFDPPKLLNILKLLKDYAIPISQISRITSIDKRTIKSA